RVEAVWREAVQRPRKVREQELRSIQDGIHHLRTTAPVVPEGFYWRRRDVYEQQMRIAVERMSQEAQAATRLSRGASAKSDSKPGGSSEDRLPSRNAYDW